MRRLPEVALRGVVLRLLLLLPLCLSAWYLAAPAFSWIGGQVARPVVAFATEGTVAMRSEGRDVVYAVRLAAPYVYGKTVPPRASVDVSVAAATYTFGIALYLALCLSERRSRRAAAPIAWGALVLVLLPAWGIAFDALKQLGAARELADYLGWGSTWRNTVALGYQVGALLLPTLAPVAAWLVALSSSPPGASPEREPSPSGLPPRS